MLQAIMYYLDSLRTRREEGQGMVEYALILALISVVAIVVLALVGDQIVLIFEEIVDALTP